MRIVVAHMITTLDGVVGFDSVTGQIMKLRGPEVLADFFDEVRQEDAMLLGRVTYQQWAGYWPNSTVQPFADHINSVAKFVASQTLSATPWGHGGSATLLKGRLADSVTALKSGPGRNIGVHGSPTLVESLLQEDLLDELRLEIYPLVAGSGARLLPSGGVSKHFELAKSKIASNGVAILTYRCLHGSRDA